MDNDYMSILVRKRRWHRHSILLGKFFHHHCFLFHMMNSQTFSSANFILDTNFFEVKHDPWVQVPLYVYFSKLITLCIPLLLSETAPANINIHRFISVYVRMCVCMYVCLFVCIGVYDNIHTPISINCCCYS